MQQWVCHIKGLENIFAAQQVEKICRQIDGAQDVHVDFAAELIFLSGASRDVFIQVKDKLGNIGYPVVIKGYFIRTLIDVPELANEDVQSLVSQKIGKHSQVFKMEVRPLSQQVYLVHLAEYPLTKLICDLNNCGVLATVNRQLAKPTRETLIRNSLGFVSILLFIFAMLNEFLYTIVPHVQAGYMASIVLSFGLIAQRAARQFFLFRQFTYEVFLLLIAIPIAVQNMWLEGAVLGLVVCTLWLLESWLTSKLRQYWSEYRAIIPVFAFIKTESSRRVIEADSIKPGDRIVVLPGECLAADGVVVSGTANVSSEKFTSTVAPVQITADEKVFAGMLVVDGELEVEVKSEPGQSALARLIKKLASSQTNITERQVALARGMNYLLFAIAIIFFLLAIIIYLPDPLIGKEWLETLFTIAVLASTGSILVSVQMSQLFSSLLAAKKGIIVFQYEVWEKLSNLRLLILDKLGVVSKNISEVQEVISLSDTPISEVLSIAAALAKSSGNFRLNSIVERASENGNSIRKVKKFRDESEGLLCGEVKGKTVRLGSQLAMEKLGLMNDVIRQKSNRWQEEGANAFFVANENSIIGMITVLDQFYEDVNDFVSTCRKFPVDNIVLMSNDNKESSSVIANRYGIKELLSNLSESEKQAEIDELEKRGVMLLMSTRSDFKMSERSVLLCNDALQYDQYDNATQMASLGNRLIPIAQMVLLSKALASRINRLLAIYMLVKILTVIAVLMSLFGLTEVIVVELLLGMFVLSTSFQPQRSQKSV